MGRLSDVPILEKAWNHNTHYHRRLLRLVPDDCDRALDVGSGDGTFARQLAARSFEVVALDSAEQQVEQSRRSCADLTNVSVVHADFFAADLEDETFDVVTALASVHHLPFAPALERMRDLLRPGGKLIVLGLWTDNSTARERVLNHLAGAMNKVYQRAWGPDLMTAPSTMPEMSLRDVRREAATLSPPATVRRCLLWRYILVWQKPEA